MADAMILRRDGKTRTFGLWPVELEPDKDASVG